ncbi:hypothetical protein Gohar_021386 [Gossypium harknessii]|uniref:Uncharacterized protein n=1 Tax=Gossypium harknessii TaxID=34285 RepID=A0A7J9IBH5_9ROSI|nr:hypothetical protein [Gossypium harknessii]
MHNYIRESNFLASLSNTCVVHPQILKCFRLVFLSCYNLYEVFDVAFEESLKVASAINILKAVFEFDCASLVNRVNNQGKDITILALYVGGYSSRYYVSVFQFQALYASGYRFKYYVPVVDTIPMVGIKYLLQILVSLWEQHRVLVNVLNVSFCEHYFPHIRSQFTIVLHAKQLVNEMEMKLYGIMSYVILVII